MIAKRIDTKAATSRVARLVKYVVAAQGGIDPRSWTRTADYVLNSGTSNRGEKVGGVRVTNCHTDDPAAATALIECIQTANTRSKTDKTYHLVFSFPPGEEPALEILHAIEDQLCASIGYAGHQRISAVHIDCDHLHVHVAINKVHPKGYQNIEPYFDKKKLMEECDLIERKYKLTRTNHGLTGEKAHERFTKIKLDPQQSHSARIRDRLGKSYDLSIIERPEAETLNDLRNLSGGDVVHNSARHSLLLSGNAPDRLEPEGTEHPDGLRRSGNGTGRDRSSIGNGPANMEAHAGVESLTGFVSREVAPAMRLAGNWQQLHAALASHGLHIKKRGAGLVIGSGNLWVRASQCDRSFSLKGLTDRLGPFEANQRKDSNKAYEPKPIQAHASSAALFETYQRDRDKYIKVRSYGLEQARYEGAVLEANVQKWKKAQRALVKLAAKGQQRRAGLKLVTLQIASIRKTNWRTIEEKRRRVIKDTAFPPWAAWLAQQAERGDTEALAVLRSRQEREAMQGDILTAAKPTNAENIILKGLKLAADAKGALHYNTQDGGLVIDRKTHVQSFRTTAESSLMALQIAAERFKGQTLIIEGQQSFQKEIARLAGIHGITIRLSGPAKKTIKQKNKAIINEAEL